MKARRNKWLLSLTATGAAGAMAAALMAASPAAGAAGAAGPARAASALVSVASPAGQFPRNSQNMPALAVDPVNPNVLAASGNDLVDMQSCSKKAATTVAACSLPAGEILGGNFNFGVGMSAVYFSFNRGHSWSQPSYRGLTATSCKPTAARCTPKTGVIHTVPNYAENGLRSRGNTAVAFGPVRKNGKFSYANGSRLYYATLATNLTDTAIRPGHLDSTFALTVSHLDNPTPARVARQPDWSDPVTVPAREPAISFPLGDQIWADDASSSRFFGRVYACYTDIHVPATGDSLPIYERIAVSADGGRTWKSHLVAPPVDSASQGYHMGCAIRTDSHGGVYAFFTHYPGEFPGDGVTGGQTLVASANGGRTWTKPRDFIKVNTGCFFKDPIYDRCSMEGPAGARSDFEAAPGVSIANGAPTGAHATNEIVDSWSDARFGPDQQAALLAYSRNQGQTWSAPVKVSVPGDRAMYSAPAIAPDGSHVYVTYNAFTTPFDIMTTAPRLEHGVLRSAPIGSGGAPGRWTTDFTGPSGDARGTSPGDFNYSEYLGNYVYAIAAPGYGVGVWTDVPHTADCPAIDKWRQASFNSANLVLPAPWPLADCRAHFGNSDISSATTAP